jgi:hypothetical protein
MWKKLVDRAFQRGAAACSLFVLTWNKPSMEFYKTKGAVDLMEELRVLRINKEGIEESLAGESSEYLKCTSTKTFLREIQA